MADQSAIRAGKAVVELRGDDTNLKEVTKRSEKYLKDLGKAGQDVGKATSGGMLERLALRAKAMKKERRTSGESALEKMMGSGGNLATAGAQALGIGLPVMIAEQLGKGFAEATEKVVELRKQYREGTLDEAEMARGLATGLPVLGDWVKGFLNIRDMITGEREELKKVKEETRRGTEEWNARVKAAEKYREILSHIRLATSKALGEAGVMGKDEFTQERNRIYQDSLALQERRANRLANPLGASADFDRENEPMLKAMEEEHKIKKQAAKVASAGPEKEKADADLTQFEARLKSVKDQISARQQEIQKADQAEMDAEGKLLEARAGNVNQKEYAERVREAMELRQMQNAAIKDRETREMAELDTRYQAEINAAQLSGKQTFGIWEKYGQARANLEERHAQERADREREESLRLQEIQLQGVQNQNQRELALLDAKYQAEVDKAKAHPGEREESAIRKQWAAERSQMEIQQAREVADAQHEMDVQIEQERTALHKRGLAERLAQLAAERREALRRENDPRTTTGIGDARISALYDLKEQRARMLSQSAAGSFSAAEVSRMGSTGPLDDIAKATKATAEHTRRMAANGGPVFGS